MDCFGWRQGTMVGNQFQRKSQRNFNRIFWPKWKECTRRVCPDTRAVQTGCCGQNNLQWPIRLLVRTMVNLHPLLMPMAIPKFSMLIGTKIQVGGLDRTDWHWTVQWVDYPIKIEFKRYKTVSRIPSWRNESVSIQQNAAEIDVRWELSLLDVKLDVSSH